MIAESKHQGGSNPMEQFVLLAKSAKGAAAAELVKQALETPGVYVFSELLDMQSIKDLASDHKQHWELLNLFAFGTLKDYVEKRAQNLVPDLSIGQRKKLQYLTIVTLSEREKCIPYQTLQNELDIANVRQLEDLIIEAIYAEIIQGKLDQSRGFLEIDTTIGRDIRKEDIPVITNTLESWCDACENMLVALQNQIERANTEKSQKLQRKEALEQEIANLKKTVKSHSQDGDDVMADSREAMGVEKTPSKKMIKKGIRGSSKLFNK
ncbi:COP9 signalosome complex subunit 7a [Orchesella cincta]|uniref:COP9 signalosome complex subunit 7a n=1 Tax=Orchesella cincta TaxID=48709 RepID=A0A1D2N606_ORCCI|nr:COP9 signalosome complex subunit 7a [Orchesella cincta]